MDRRECCRECYENMTEEEKERNRLVMDLDLVLGGKPDRLFELLSYLDFEKQEHSLELRSIVKEMEEELGFPKE